MEATQAINYKLPLGTKLTPPSRVCLLNDRPQGTPGFPLTDGLPRRQDVQSGEGEGKYKSFQET